MDRDITDLYKVKYKYSFSLRFNLSMFKCSLFIALANMHEKNNKNIFKPVSSAKKPLLKYKNIYATIEKKMVEIVIIENAVGHSFDNEVPLSWSLIMDWETPNPETATVRIIKNLFIANKEYWSTSIKDKANKSILKFNIWKKILEKKYNINGLILLIWLDKFLVLSIVFLTNYI